MKKATLFIMALSVIAASFGLVGCMGGEENTKADQDKINKDLEGMPKAGPDPMGAPQKKGAGG